MPALYREGPFLDRVGDPPEISRFVANMRYVHVKRLLCIAVLILAIQLQFGATSVQGATDKGASSVSTVTWKELSTAAVPNSYFNVLESVSCPSASFCVAVGFTNPSMPEGGLYASNGNAPLIEEFNGTRWRLVSSPTDDGQLASVSCASIRFCVAVGRSTGEDSTNLILMDTGGHWSIGQDPDAAPFSQSGDKLAGVSCVSARFCLAVGAEMGNDVQSGQDSQLIFQDQSIQEWNGTAWSQNPGPNTMWHGGLQAVSCINGPICVADGYGDDWPGPPATPVESENGALTEVLRGSSWSSAPGLVPSDLSCVSGTFCLGAAGNQALYGVSLYSSGKWTTNTLPVTNSLVVGVACISRHACTAVGDTHNARALVSVFDGSRWSENRAGNLPSHVEQELYAVSCAPNGRCVAVGDAGSLTSSSGGSAYSISIVSSGG